MPQNLRDKLWDFLTESQVQLTQIGDVPEQDVMNWWKGAMAKGLAFIPPGRYGTKLHNAFSERNPQISVCFALLRNNPDGDGETEVLLRFRGKEEAYPEQFSLCANAICIGESELMVIDRILKPFSVSLASAVELPTARFTVREERGDPWHHLVYNVEVNDEPQLQNVAGTGWFGIDHLPGNMVSHHRDKVLKPVLRYRANLTRCNQAIAILRSTLGD